MDNMTTMTAVFVFFALMTKHWICDFGLQTTWQVINKGTYGHPAGIIHASITAVGTVITLAIVLPYHNVFWLIALLEGLFHYHIDWAKANLNAKWNLNPMQTPFWWLLGFDQWLHNLNYVAILVWLMIAGAYIR
jgi:hypothetical protein